MTHHRKARLEELDRLCKPDINRSALQRTLIESRRARMDLREQFFALFDQPLCPLVVNCVVVECCL